MQSRVEPPQPAPPQQLVPSVAAQLPVPQQWQQLAGLMLSRQMASTGLDPEHGRRPAERVLLQQGYRLRCHPLPSQAVIHSAQRRGVGEADCGRERWRGQEASLAGGRVRRQHRRESWRRAYGLCRQDNGASAICYLSTRRQCLLVRLQEAVNTYPVSGRVQTLAQSIVVTKC